VIILTGNVSCDSDCILIFPLCCLFIRFTSTTISKQKRYGTQENKNSNKIELICTTLHKINSKAHYSTRCCCSAVFSVLSNVSFNSRWLISPVSLRPSQQEAQLSQRQRASAVVWNYCYFINLHEYHHKSYNTKKPKVFRLNFSQTILF